MTDVTVLVGDCLALLRTLPDQSVHTCVTSPPYFGLRDYGVDGQIGLEDTPDAFVARLVEVFREVRRVLRDDGTLFLNLGDSFSTGAPDIADLLAGRLEGGVLFYGCAHPRCGAPEGIHILVDDQAAPDGVFEPLLRAQRVTIKQGDDDLCEIGGAFDAPVTCWARRSPGRRSPDGANAEGAVNVGENVRVIVAAGNLHTDAALRAVVSRAVKHGQASFPVEVAGEPPPKAVARIIPTLDSLTFDTGAIGVPQRDAVDEAITLLDGVDLGASRGRYLRVGKAAHEEVTFRLHGGREICVFGVGHLSLLLDGLTPYYKLLAQAIKERNVRRPKQELGIPDMVKRALMEDGWICRQTIIWHKPNPMPESVRDRCTKAHEYVFLLSKAPRYYFDSEAIKEPVAESSVARLAQPALAQQAGSARVPGKTNGNMKAVGNGETRNRRSVWTVTTKPFKGAHFATFPPDLIEPCILAGCPVGGTVLDPFGGSGTTAGVALKHGRNAILCELNPDYAALVNARVDSIAGRQETLL